MGPGPVELVPSVGGLSKGPRPNLREFRRKPQKTLTGRQARPRIEPGTSHLLVLRAEPLSH